MHRHHCCDFGVRVEKCTEGQHTEDMVLCSLRLCGRDGWEGLHRHNSIPFPVHRIQRCMRLLFSCSVVSNSFAIPWTVAHQAPLSMGFSRQEHWSVLPFPSPGDLPDPGIEHSDPCLLHWQEDYGWATREAPKRYTRLTHFITSEVDFGQSV